MEGEDMHFDREVEVREGQKKSIWETEKILSTDAQLQERHNDVVNTISTVNPQDLAASRNVRTREFLSRYDSSLAFNVVNDSGSEQYRSAVLIQKTWRAYLSRKVYFNLLSKRFAALEARQHMESKLKLQEGMAFLDNVRRVEKEKERKIVGDNTRRKREYASVVIQRNYRKYAQKRNKEKALKDTTMESYLHVSAPVVTAKSSTGFTSNYDDVTDTLGVTNDNLDVFLSSEGADMLAHIDDDMQEMEEGNQKLIMPESEKQRRRSVQSSLFDITPSESASSSGLSTIESESNLVSSAAELSARTIKNAEKMTMEEALHLEVVLHRVLDELNAQLVIELARRDKLKAENEVLQADSKQMLDVFNKMSARTNQDSALKQAKALLKRKLRRKPRTVAKHTGKKSVNGDDVSQSDSISSKLARMPKTRR